MPLSRGAPRPPTWLAPPGTHVPYAQDGADPHRHNTHAGCRASFITETSQRAPLPAPEQKSPHQSRLAGHGKARPPSGGMSPHMETQLSLLRMRTNLSSTLRRLSQRRRLSQCCQSTDWHSPFPSALHASVDASPSSASTKSADICCQVFRRKCRRHHGGARSIGKCSERRRRDRQQTLRGLAIVCSLTACRSPLHPLQWHPRPAPRVQWLIQAAIREDQLVMVVMEFLREWHAIARRSSDAASPQRCQMSRRKSTDCDCRNEYSSTQATHEYSRKKSITRTHSSSSGLLLALIRVALGYYSHYFE